MNRNEENDGWAIPLNARQQYVQRLVVAFGGNYELLSNAQMRPVLSQGLTPAQIESVLLLADVNHDAWLSTQESILAMHLACLLRQGKPLPAVLPAELVPPKFRLQPVLPDNDLLAQLWTNNRHKASELQWQQLSLQQQRIHSSALGEFALMLAHFSFRFYLENISLLSFTLFFRSLYTIYMFVQQLFTPQAFAVHFLRDTLRFNFFMQLYCTI